MTQKALYRVSQIDVYGLWNVISKQRNETEMQFILCSIPQTSLSPYMFKISTFCHSTLPHKDVEQSDIPSGLLLMEYHWWHIQSDLSVPLVFAVLWHTQCSLKFLKGRSLEWLNREIEVEISLLVELLFLPHRRFNTCCTVSSTSNLSQILFIVTFVGGGVPNSTLQCRWFSTFSTFQ